MTVSMWKLCRNSGQVQSGLRKLCQYSVSLPARKLLPTFSSSQRSCQNVARACRATLTNTSPLPPLLYYSAVCRCNSMNICIGETIPNPGGGISMVSAVEDHAELRVCLNSYDEEIFDVYFLYLSQIDPPPPGGDDDKGSVVLIPYGEADAVIDPTTGLLLHPDMTYEVLELGANGQVGVITFPIDNTYSYVLSGVLLLGSEREESFQLEIVNLDAGVAQAADDPFAQLNLGYTKEVGGCTCQAQR